MPAAASVADADYALWISDSYHGSRFTDIYLHAGDVSDPIDVSFVNDGPLDWGSDEVLAQWNGSDDGPPLAGSAFCDDPPKDWSSCDPAIADWIGDGTVTPGQVATFEFRIKAPPVNQSTDYTVYFRPARRNGTDSYSWLDARRGARQRDDRTYEVFTVHVAPAIGP